MSTAGIAYSLQQTLVSPALPVLKEDLGTSTTWLAWLVSGFLLFSVISTPLLGSLGDQHGKKRLLLLAMSFFFAGAVGAAFAPNIAVLIVCRCVQGLGGAIFPLSFAIIKDEFPPRRVGPAIGAIASTWAAATGFSFLLSGFIVELLSWRWLFGFGALVVGIALLLVYAFVPESSIRTPARLDVPGALLLGGALSGLLVALTEGNAWGWHSPQTLGLFAAAAAGLVLWVAVELRTETPLVDVRMLARRSVSLTNTATAAAGWVTQGAALLLIPLFVATPESAGYGFGASTIRTGLYLLPIGVVGAVASAFVSKLVSRIGAKWLSWAGFCCGAVGFASCAVWHDQPWQLYVGIAGIAICAGVNLGVLAIVMVGLVRPHETGVAAGMQTVIRAVGAVLGAQIGAAILSAGALGRTQPPPESAFVTAFAVAACVAALGAVLTPLIAVRRRSWQESQPATPQ